MTADDACTVAARMEHLPVAIACVETFCDERGLAPDDALRLCLVVEELFTNTVMHGHGGGSDEPVRIALRAGPSHLELSYEDEAPPFDPVAHHARSTLDPDADLADRPIGQLGIPLVVMTAERITYARQEGRNIVRLALRRRAP